MVRAALCVWLCAVCGAGGARGEGEEHADRSQHYELLLCRTCGADVADASYLLDKLSPNARRTEKRALFGRHNLTVQSLVNPYGVQFDVVTVEKARCTNIGSRQSAESWFSGYTWRVCTCPHCGQHLGWTFESGPHDETTQTNKLDDIHKFHGLIMSNILGENFTDSLLMIPKTYRM